MNKFFKSNGMNKVASIVNAYPFLMGSLIRKEANSGKKARQIKLLLEAAGKTFSKSDIKKAMPFINGNNLANADSITLEIAKALGTLKPESIVSNPTLRNTVGKVNTYISDLEKQIAANRGKLIERASRHRNRAQYLRNVGDLGRYNTSFAKNINAARESASVDPTIQKIMSSITDSKNANELLKLQVAAAKEELKKKTDLYRKLLANQKETWNGYVLDTKRIGDEQLRAAGDNYLDNTLKLIRSNSAAIGKANRMGNIKGLIFGGAGIGAGVGGKGLYDYIKNGTDN